MGSSYCFLKILLENGTEIIYEGEDGATPMFTTPRCAEKKLNAIDSLDAFLAFLNACKEEDYDDNSSIAFYKSLESIQSIDEIKSIFLDYGEIFDLGDYYGGSIEYHFKDKHFKKSSKPDKEWLSEVEGLF